MPTTRATIGTPDRRTSAKVVAGSLLVGCLSAAALVAGPFAVRDEATTTGAILLGFAVGWALLAVLSARRGGGSHRWAAVPAAVLGVSGFALVLLKPDGETLEASSSSGAARVAGDRLIAVGDHRLNIRCVGSGSPTVVLEPGLGEPASDMAKLIAPQVARMTQVCVYDRAGHGRSDAAPDAGAARDLHELLRRAHVRGPVVLAGHSLGGMFVLSYADRYPAEVAGVALIDSMHPKQTHTAADMDRVLAVAPTIARTGIARLLLDPTDGRPVDQARQFVRDVAQMPADLDRAARLKTLGDRPLGVVTASDGSQPGWANEQDDLARLSSRSFHRTVADSTHGSLVLDPDDARASSSAIADVVLQVRG